MNKSKNKVGIIAALIIGFGLLIWGVRLFTAENNMRQECTMETQGKVIDLLEHVSTDDEGDDVISYSPVFEFVLDGESYTKATTASSGLRNFSVGQAVTVFYNPADPWQFYVSEYVLVENIGYIALICVGCIFILCGGYSAVNIVKSKKNTK